MQSERTNCESLIRELGGCGRFQVLFIFLVCFSYIHCAFCSIFIGFGNYNPGWRCVGNVSMTTDTNNTGGTLATKQDTEPSELKWAVRNTSHTSEDKFTGSCTDYYPDCQIEFNPAASTIVTEWALVCDRAWLISIIIFVQMAGVALGSLVSGYIGDQFGRKRALYLSFCSYVLLCIFCIFSVSWQMFAAISFLLNFMAAQVYSLLYVYTTEFTTTKWRAVVNCMPDWCVGCIFFAVSALIFKDWRHMYIANAVLSSLSLLPALWVPESLRWLLVKGKNEQALKVAKQVAKTNKVDFSHETQDAIQREKIEVRSQSTTGFTPLHLFRKDTLLITSVLGFSVLCSCMTYFATSFGVAVLPGNIYVNNIIMYVTELPGTMLCWFVPDRIGRKYSFVLSGLTQTTFLFIVVAFDLLLDGNLRRYGMLILIIISKIFGTMRYDISVLYANELYPTTMRSAGGSWIIFAAGVGSVLSATIVPTDKNVLYISYLVMASICFFSSFLGFLLPETSKKDIQDTLKTTPKRESFIFGNDMQVDNKI